MILTNRNQCLRYEPLLPALRTIMDYISTHNMLEAPLGRITLDGDNLFINNSEVDALKRADQVLEVHRRYIDVHILLQGEETVGWLPLEKITHFTRPYDEDGDFAFADDAPSTYFTMKPGDMLIAYPEDGHAPIIGEGKIRKLIAKIRI